SAGSRPAGRPIRTTAVRALAPRPVDRPARRPHLPGPRGRRVASVVTTKLSSATVVGCARRKAPDLGPHQVADSGEKGLAGLDDVEAGVLQHGAKLVRARITRLEIAEDLEHRRGYQPT